MWLIPLITQFLKGIKMSESKFWLTLWLGILFSVVILVLGILYIDKVKTVELAKLSYEKVTIVGHNFPVYQKRCCDDSN